VKRPIQQSRAEAVVLQKISRIDGTVVKSTAVDEPLAEVPPKLVDVDWDAGQLRLVLDKSVTPEWVQALHHAGTMSYVIGKPPQVFSFLGKIASVQAVAEHQVQSIVDHFKNWLPAASRTLKASLAENARREEAAKNEQLRRERAAEEQRLRILRNIRI
jgi:hypothetical protein